MYFEFELDSFDIIIALGGLLGIYLTFSSPKKHCPCGVKIPERGGMASQQMLCDCGEYNGRAVMIQEQELKRIEEEKKKGNSYDTFL